MQKRLDVLGAVGSTVTNQVRAMGRMSGIRIISADFAYRACSTFFSMLNSSESSALRLCRVEVSSQGSCLGSSSDLRLALLMLAKTV